MGLGEASLRDLPQCRAKIRQEGLEGRQERVKADLLATGGHRALWPNYKEGT